MEPSVRASLWGVVVVVGGAARAGGTHAVRRARARACVGVRVVETRMRTRRLRVRSAVRCGGV